LRARGTMEEPWLRKMKENTASAKTPCLERGREGQRREKKKGDPEESGQKKKKKEGCNGRILRESKSSQLFSETGEEGGGYGEQEMQKGWLLSTEESETERGDGTCERGRVKGKSISEKSQKDIDQDKKVAT